MSGVNTLFLKQYGGRLLEKGYPIVPIKKGFKFPKGLSGWEQIKANEKHLKKWLSNGFAEGGVGVITKDIPAVDIDVYDEDIVNLLVAWCEKHIGPTVQRVGESPKVLLVYRTERSIKKIISRVYEDFLGLKHKIEILGDGQQFVAFAVHPNTDKPYKWVTEKSLADVNRKDLPVLTEEKALELVAYYESIVPEDWIIAEKGQKGKEIDFTLSASERILNHSKQKVDISTQRLIKILNRLDPNMSNADWVRVGMAIFHQYDGNSEGFGIYDNWSSVGDTYDPENIVERWRSFRADLATTEPVTVATILRMARLADEQANGDLIGTFIEQYVYIQDGDRVCDIKKPPHCSVSRLAEFKNRTANIRYEILAPTAKDPDNTKLEPVWKSWMVDPKRLSAEGTVYAPKGGRVITDDYGLDWVNEFHMPKLSETAARENLAVFFEHMVYLFPKKIEREWFISWMAFNLQFPERRCKVAPLHVAVSHGTGRGWIVELLGKLVGQWNCSKTKTETLSGEGSAGAYQDYLNKSLICAIEEVKEGGKRFAVSDKIRDRITEPYLEVNLKYGGKKTQQVFTNFFFMSNHPDALVLTAQDRRINVFECPHEPKDEEYYDVLYGWLESDGVVQLYNFLRERDLSKFNWKRSIDTEARTRMIHNNRTETEVMFWELVENPHYPAMTFKQIIREMRKLSDKDEFDTEIEEGQLTKLLQHHATGPIRIKAEGEMRRAWQLVKGKKLDNKEIRAALTECGL